MQFSTDYIIRRSPFFEPPPNRRSLVTDLYTNKVIGCVGSHQRCLDLSRCYRLRDPKTYELLGKNCTSLIYLDLSYTHLLDLHVLRPLVVLRALIIGGVRVNDFSELKHLDTLEILSLRSCRGLQHLNDLRDLVTLRSLDIGWCPKVVSINSLEKLTRLEELVLDSSGLQSLQCIDDCIACISGLPDLLMLNVNNTVLSDCRDRLSATMRPEAVIEADSRDVMFLRAAIENNVEKLLLLIGSGQDLDVRAGEDMSEYLVSQWLLRCEGSTAFVDCCHDDEVLRPTALHLAIFFNCIEAVEVLVYYGSNIDITCWFSDVKLVNGKLVYDEEKALFNAEVKKISDPRYKHRLEVDPPTLITICFEGNFVRLIMGFKNNKIANWKEIAKFCYYKLLAVVTGTIDENPDLCGAGPTPSSLLSRTEKVIKHADLDGDRGAAVEGETEDNAFNQPYADDEEASIGSLDSLAGMMRSMKSKTTHMKPAIQYRGQPCWRDIGMVRKLSGRPIQLMVPTCDSMQVTGNGNQKMTTINVLGKKSYWLESYRQAAVAKEKKRVEDYDKLKIKPSLYRTIAPVDSRLVTISAFQRKEDFFAILNREAEKANMIRDEDLGHDDLQGHQNNTKEENNNK